MTAAKDIRACVARAAEKAAEYAARLGLTVEEDPDYDFRGRRAVAAYRCGSARTGTVRFAVNAPALEKEMRRCGVPAGELEEQVLISVLHETGHGIIERLRQLRRTDAWKRTHVFSGRLLKEFKEIIRDEETAAEDFGAFAAGRRPFSLIETFLREHAAEVMTVLHEKRG